MVMARVGCLGILVVAACGGDDGAVVTDSTGDSFRITCEGAACDVDAVSDGVPMPSCDGGETAGYSFFAGRFVDLTAACFADDGTWTSLGHWGRPAACERDDDCPALLDATFECRAGLCQNVDVAAWPEDVVTRSDVWFLCSATVPRSATIGDGADAQTLVDIGARVDAACGADTPSDAVCPLPLPDGCMQPR